MPRLGVFVCWLTVAAAGCGPGGQPRRTIEVKPPAGLDQVRSVLNNYAAGQPRGSEYTAVPGYIDDVAKTDPGKAEMLRTGFKEIEKATPAELPAKAKALLAKL